MKRIALFARLFALALGLFAVTGCGSVRSAYMTKVPGGVPLVDPAAATVVFVRPSNYAGRMKTIIIDQSGRFLGECWGRTSFATRMPPGHYQFASWGEGTPVLDAQVEAGKIYYVEVGTSMGAWESRARMFGIGPARENWDELPVWLATTQTLLPNEAKGQEYLRSRPDAVQTVLSKARTSWGSYDPMAQQKRSITLADGVGAPVSPATR